MPDAIDGWIKVLFLLVPALALAPARTQSAEPRLASDRYQLELVAAELDIVTPIAAAFDRQGRLLVVESHTHQRPGDYQGPTSDRIRMFADSDGDGQLDRWTTFAEGFRFAVGVLPRSDGAVYVIARQSIALVKDTDGDGQADQRSELVRLESEDEYPHNGLEGIALAPDGSLLFGLGENHGMAYTLTGSDGTQLKGKGGVDGVFRATLDGGKLEHYAGGCWNPFSICFDPRGRLFAADNDPDSSPPCRLLQIVSGGDYGFLFQYGRAGTHPLQAWNGELPGTLPMVCGIGEAPTAIVAHAGRLWVTSWGDHRLEAYRLVPKGASFTAEREVVVQGGTEFRPTALAVGPDGSLYFGDWMLRDYPVHGRGRIWRLALPADELKHEFPPLSADEQHALSLSDAAIDDALCSDDPFLQAAAVNQLAMRSNLAELVAQSSADPRVRLGRLVALRRQASPPDVALLRSALADESPDVRLYAVRWIADERIEALRDDVAKLLDGPLPSARYYLAVLGAVDWFDREPELRDSGINDALLVRELRNERRPPAVHALALRLISPDTKFLTIEQLRRYLQDDHEPLRLEAIRTLAQQTSPDRFGLLESTVRDTAQSDAVRLEALVGLTASADHARELLERFTEDENPVLQREAERLLRLARLRPVPVEAKPPADDLAAWNRVLAEPGEIDSGHIEAGRRLFFSPVGPRCSVCHQYDGRGGRTGPDLTQIGRSSSRERIIASILQPSQEIAPHFQSWVLVTNDGKTHAGLRLAKAGDDGIEPYVDSEGREFSLASDDVESRTVSTTSIMPDGLENTLSIADLRDLVSFLAAPSDAGK